MTTAASMSGRSRVTSVLVLTGSFSGALALLTALSAPAPFLLSGVMAGMISALSRPATVVLPQVTKDVGLGIIGVSAGSLATTDVVRTVVDSPVAIALGVVGTLTISMAAGQILRLTHQITLPTALFASIAGAASGVSGIAREANADEAVVSAIQYLRVVLVLCTVSLVSPLIAGSANGSANAMPKSVVESSWPPVIACLVLGLLCARILPFAASRLILPMAIAATASVSQIADTHVPPLLMNIGFAAVGLAVGISFTWQSLKIIRRIYPYILAQLLISVAGCAAVGVGVAKMADVSALDGYLATTPAGLPAVTAVALESGSDIGLVITMQIVRVFAALLLASLLGSLFAKRRFQGPRGAEDPIT